MVRHVYERVKSARRIERVLIATDDERIAETVRAFGGEVVMTSADHVSGTDRIAEAARGIEAEIVVNVQGDEPMLEPSAVDAAVEPLLTDPALDIATLSVPLGVDDMLEPSVVKVVADQRGRAMYFSRSPVPFVRSAGSLRDSAEAAAAQGLARKHVGVYAFRRAALERFVSLAPSPLEQAEALEQLRALEHGMSMAVVALGGTAGVAVDTPEDLERVRALMATPRGVWT